VPFFFLAMLCAGVSCVVRHPGPFASQDVSFPQKKQSGYDLCVQVCVYGRACSHRCLFGAHRGTVWNVLSECARCLARLSPWCEYEDFEFGKTLSKPPHTSDGAQAPRRAHGTTSALARPKSLARIFTVVPRDHRAPDRRSRQRGRPRRPCPHLFQGAPRPEPSLWRR
jgi:hypothetical protein